MSSAIGTRQPPPPSPEMVRPFRAAPAQAGPWHRFRASAQGGDRQAWCRRQPSRPRCTAPSSRRPSPRSPRPEGIARRGLVLEPLTALKQVCNHPAQYLGPARGLLAGRSGKLDAFDELVTAILDGGEQILVFTQYVAIGADSWSGAWVERGVASSCSSMAGWHCRPTAGDGRPASSWRDTSVLLLSLRAGGTVTQPQRRPPRSSTTTGGGTPAVEDQASDRAWRNRTALARFRCTGSLLRAIVPKNRVAALLTAKRQLADTVVGGGGARLAEPVRRRPGGPGDTSRSGERRSSRSAGAPVQSVR